MTSLKKIDDGSFLEHMGIVAHPYNPTKTLTSAPNNKLIEKDPATGYRDVDFDAIEVLNPDGDKELHRMNGSKR